jgi:hypothetical protein
MEKREQTCVVNSTIQTIWGNGAQIISVFE